MPQANAYSDWTMNNVELFQCIKETTPGLIDGISNSLPEDFPDKMAGPILEGMLKCSKKINFDKCF